MVEPVLSQKISTVPLPFSAPWVKKNPDSTVLSFATNLSFPSQKPTFVLFFKKKTGAVFLFLFLGMGALSLAAYRVFSLQREHHEMGEAFQKQEQKWAQQKRDLDFFKKNKLDFNPQQYLGKSEKLTRLEIGEKLKALAEQADFQEMTFTLMPEKKMTLQTGTPALLTKISVFYKALSDTDLAAWVGALRASFPAFLVSRHLTIERSQRENREEFSDFQGVEGAYVFDFVAVE